MTDTYDPLEQLVVRVLRLQIEGGHLWLDPAALTEDMIIRWFGVSRASAIRTLCTLNHEPPGKDTVDDGPVRTSMASARSGPTASTITDAVLDLLYAELARMKEKLSDRHSAV
ncbi:hypothetical protein [Streptomyces prunicolor]|uniref:hypothetical protein n=1 Tax=Streptomyces prunicolor TaxID=67348 RepID=UPI0003647871|nr:hypothetical protein [Streptomyces prunicolor]